MDISVVIPLYNEEESIPELYAWIERVMAANGYTYEVIFVNDGSTDGSWKAIEQLAARSEQVRGIKFRRNYGKSPALYCGFEAAQGDVVITMDADLQDSPDEIPGLYKMIKDDGYDLVLSGHTHGGQMIPINYLGQWLGVNDLRYGHERRQNTDFIVSSGISDWELLFKTGCHSEYVLIDLLP